MLPKENRLPSSKIKNVLQSRTRISGPELLLVFQKNNLSVSRFAVIVGSNIDKRATARNRIKRLIRESIRHLLSRTPTGFDYVFIAKANLKDKKQAEVENLVKDVLK